MLLAKDQELLARFRAGHSPTLGVVYAHYLPDVERALTRGFPFRDGERSLRFFGFTRSYELSDAIQDTFLKAFNVGARLSYNGTAPYRPYLLQMARNVVIDKHRHGRISPDRLVSLQSSETAVGVEDAAARTQAAVDDPETAMLRAEASMLVADFVAGQDGDTQTLLRVHFDEERSQSEAAAALGLRRSELRARIEVVRSRLLRFLKSRGFIDQVDRETLLRALEERPG